MQSSEICPKVQYRVTARSAKIEFTIQDMPVSQSAIAIVEDDSSYRREILSWGQPFIYDFIDSRAAKVRTSLGWVRRLGDRTIELALVVLNSESVPSLLTRPA